MFKESYVLFEIKVLIDNVEIRLICIIYPILVKHILPYTNPTRKNTVLIYLCFINLQSGTHQLLCVKTYFYYV